MNVRILRIKRTAKAVLISLLLCVAGIANAHAQTQGVLQSNFMGRTGCDLTIDLYDSYGDGWNGNKLILSYEGGYEEISLDGGSSDSQILFVPDGAHIILGWIIGSWTGECSFTISYANGNIIYHGENLNGDFSFEFDMDCEGMPATTFNIIATANPTEGGTMTGDGTFEAGQFCTVTATASEGYAFMYWTEDGYIVSSNPNYSFAVTGNRDLVANFGDNTPIDFADDNVKAICVANWDFNGDGELSYGEAAAVTDLDYAFYHYDQITSFDELQYFIGLTSIGEAAFAECWNLSSIVIPNSVTSIGGYAFSNCWNLSSIEIPNFVTSIGNSAFYGCTGLTSMMVALGNTYYDSRDNCNAIIETATNTLVVGCKNTVIPNSVTSIGGGAFYSCTGLTSVEIPNSVISIGGQAFEGCTSLTSVEIPSSVTSIGESAFEGCAGLTSVEIPNSVNFIGFFAFSGCTGLTSMIVASGNTYYDSRDNCNAIIETASNILVVGCKNTVIPNTVTSIGSHAFYYCIGLTSVEIPDSVTSIGGQAFEGCIGLTSVTIGNSVTSIGYAAFQECAGLTSVEIPNSVTSIGGQAFLGCNGLTSVTIPSSVTYVGSYAFSSCGNMTIATVLAETPPEWDYEIFDVANMGLFVFVPCGSEETYTSIGWGGAHNIFGMCDGTLTVEAMPTECGMVSEGGSYAAGTECTITATANDGYAFSYWTLNGNMVSTEAEFTFQLAGDMAFVAHFVQASIIVFADENVKAICVDNWDFDSDGELSYAEAAAVTDLGSWWDGCPFTGTNIGTFDELQYFINLTSIEEGAFAECDNLTSIKIPNSITSIGSYAFTYCWNLSSIEIPNSVTSIGEGAFSYCNGLSSMTLLATVPPALGDGVFEDVNSAIPIYVLCESVEAYSSINWGGFSNFIGISGGTVSVSSNPMGAGTLTGGGTYDAAASCTVTATANDGYAFANWTNNGAVVSTDAFYTFTVTGDMTLVANFVPDANIVFADENVKAICIDNWDTNSDGELSYAEAAAVTELGNVFQGNQQITSFDELQHFISLTSIAGLTFYYCTGLTSVEIPNSVNSIGNSAFSGCTGLTSMTLSSSITYVHSMAFSYCNNMTTVTVLAETPPEWDYDIFEGANIGLFVYVPCESEEAYTSIGWGGARNIFGLCDGMLTVEAMPAECGMVSGGGSYAAGTECTITATANDGYAFSNWTLNGNMVSTEAEYTFQLAGDMVFVAHFVQAGNIVFVDENVKAICVDNWDIDSDGELSYAEAAAVANLGRAFQWNWDITSFDELQYFIGLTSIGGYAFSFCTSLTSVEIPNSVTSIGDGAFNYCGYLATITLPNSVTSIGWNAFYNCSSLTSIEIPNSVTSIGDGAFHNCSDLTTLLVASGNTYYDSRDNCNAIIETTTNTLIVGCKNSVIPNSVTSIGDYAFFNCWMSSIEIPNSVTSIGQEAFSYCRNMTSIEIGNSVTSIGGYAFFNCWNLSSIEIPNSVTSIGSGAFYECSSLTEIIMLGIEVPLLEESVLEESVFDETNDCPIYVPYESLNDYKTAENWSSYESRIYPWLQKDISGYGEGEGQWRFIALPLTANTEPTTVDNMVGTAFDLYRFNQSAELEWENYKANSFNSLANGQGYLYANAQDVNLVFKGAFNEDETKEINLAYDGSATFAGWNLVGNPFPVQAYANRSYYTMNAEGTAIELNAVSTSTAIPACTGIMVKAETTGENVTFSKAAPSMTTNNGTLQIAVTQANTRGLAVQDKAFVSFNAGDELGKFFFGESTAKLYITQNGKDYAIAYAEKQGEMPLNFMATKNCEYTISVNTENVELDYLHLIDDFTGEDVDLLVEPNYTFEAKTTDPASRFRLVYSVCKGTENDD